ncbi:uncharacterized protein LOC122365846 [Amphibalanus amphitrite]|uniref:uncharacterized protein LOC122365846 n=1 Tax=Amphibalanus amphitrite TaxID=1232801 RepID=UPI001C902611|nr:uncharacterized protein LOC122365846 [Amphibalanus amphitrite]
MAEAAKTAELKARAAMLKEKRDVEEQELQEMMKIKKMELKIRQRKEDLALRIEIKEAEARAQAITEEERILNTRDCGSRSSDHLHHEGAAENSMHRQILLAEDQERREAPSGPSAGHGIDMVDTDRLVFPQTRLSRSLHTERQLNLGDGCNSSDHLINQSQHPGRLPIGQNRTDASIGQDMDPSEEAYNRPQLPATESLPPPPKNDPEMERGDVMKALLMQQVRSGLPRLEISTFNGNIADFVLFIEAFDSVIGSKLETDKEKLLYLEQYTTEEPKYIVKSCLLLPATEGYAQARTRLQRRYGDERRMASAMVDKLLSWPFIKSDDIKGLDKFSIFLTGCSSSMSTGPSSVRELDHPGLLRSVVSKLPTHLQDRWRRTAVAIQDSGRSVIFHDLASFVESEVRVVSDPLFGNHVTEPREAKSYAHPKPDKSHKTNCLATSVEQRSEKYKCWCCSDDHLLENCPVLQKETSEKKRKFLMEHGMCFGCLRRGHRAAECRSRKSCEVCNGRHPTLLHEDRPAPMKQTDPHQAPSETMVKNGAVDIVAGASKLHSGMSIIPVKVRVNGGKTVSTYAFLDNGSSATFCTESLLRELEVRETEPAQLSLSTVDPNVTRVDSQIVTGMQVSDMCQTEFVSLPPVYSLRKIPVTSEDIPKQRDLQAWPHLQDIDIPEIDAEIGLMIGNDVSEIMEPWDIIHGEKPGEPFAVKTKIGWVVNGPVKTAKSDTIKVNRVGIGDTDVHQMFINMYNEDVQDTSSLNEKGMSREDHAWMEHVSSSCTRKDSGHYEIALPFREDNPELPCNRQMATQRLAGLKRKLTSDEELHRKYTAYMTEMIDKGYAEAVPEESKDRTDGKVWYIPHHGVHHAQKPDKIRVVFDCAAKYRGISLNSVLLQGPDMTNNLADVLIRLRESPVAFVADIESMFYQVGVPVEDRDVMRFLWWPGGDMKSAPKEYRMTVHLFGATSSPSCANYALRRTSEDFGGLFGEQAQKVIKQNFYVDDCLRSDETEDEAIEVAGDLRSLCRLGGFNLTKIPARQ